MGDGLRLGTELVAKRRQRPALGTAGPSPAGGASVVDGPSELSAKGQPSVKLSTPSAILTGFVLLAAAMIAESERHPPPRYAIIHATGTVLVRLDTQTGETIACVMRQNDVGDNVSAPCTGRARP